LNNVYQFPLNGVARAKKPGRYIIDAFDNEGNLVNFYVDNTDYNGAVIFAKEYCIYSGFDFELCTLCPINPFC